MAAETTTKQASASEVEKAAGPQRKGPHAAAELDVALEAMLAPTISSPIGATLAQLDAQRQHQQLHAAMWSGVVHALIHVVPTPEHEARRRLEELEQHLALLLEEKKKQRKSDARDSVFFERLVAVLGPNSAESIVAKIDKAISENGAALQNNPAAVGKIVAELAKLLSNGDTLIKLGISPQAVENRLQEAFILKLQPANKTDFAAVRPVPLRAAGPIEQPVSIGNDLVASAKSNPERVAAYLCNSDGVDLLRHRVETQKTQQDRVALLLELKEAVGQERFARILAAYDDRRGAPIASDLIRLHQGNPEAQAEIVRACFGSASKIFTPQEKERFISFIKLEQASILEVLSGENERAIQSITTIEEKRFSQLKHLADALKIRGLENLPYEEVRTGVLQAIGQRFPGLKGVSEEQALAAIRALGGKENSDLVSFREELKKLGVEPISAVDPKVQESQMRETKILMALVESHLSDVIQCDQELTRLRAIQAAGQYDEAAQVSASYDRLLGGLFPEYGAERFEKTRKQAKLYIDALAARIESSSSSERMALVAERDSLEWRALQERTRIHLSKTPPEVQRSMALVQEYVLTHDHGVGRSEIFTKAAQNIAQALQAVHAYTEAQREVLTQGRDAKIKQLAELEEEVRSSNLLLNQKLEAQGASHWNAVYSEIGKLKAWRERGVQDVTYDGGKSRIAIDKAIDAKWKEINDKWTNWGLGSKSHQDRVIQLAQDLAFKEYARDQAAAQKKELEECIQKRVLDSQTSLIQQIIHVGGAGEAVIDPRSFKSIISRSTVQTPTEPAETKYTTLLSQREVVQRSFVDTTLQARSPLFDRATGPGVSSMLSAEIQSATQCKTQAELVARLNAILLNDPSARPSKEAVDALRAALGKDSSLAKQLESVANAPSTEILMQRLYARLNMDDAARVKLFLLTYKRPSLFDSFFEGAEQASPSNAAEVWKHLHSCQPEDLHPLLMLVPSLQKKAEVEEFAAKLPDADFVDLKHEFKKATGRSLGDALISLAPAAGGARQRYLYYQIAGSWCVDSADLARFFPQGVVPDGIPERQEQLAALLHSDNTSPVAGLIRGLSENNNAEKEASERLKRLLDSHATERAMLQAALPVFVQLGRFDRADKIRTQLADLNKTFDSELKEILSTHEASAITRLGVEEQIRRMQSALTGFRVAYESDPSGPVARKAFEVMQLLEDPKVPVSAALRELRRAEFSSGQMLVFETVYAQHVMRRGPAGLTGDLSKDLSAKDGAKGVESLLRGGDNGLSEYDLIQLTEGIRTRNPALTVRAMIAIEARKHSPEAFEAAMEVAIKAGQLTSQQWEEFKKSDVAKDVSEYYDAVIKHDHVKKAALTTAILVRDGLDAGVHGIGWTVGQLGSLTKEQLSNARAYYETIYGTDIFVDLNRSMPTIYGAWENIFSGEGPQRATGVMQLAIGRLEHAAIKGIDLRLVRQALDLCSTPEQRRELVKNLDTWVEGLPGSLKYVDGRGPSIIEYVRQHGGSFGESDALFLRQALTGDNALGLTGTKLDQYIMLREQLLFQLGQADQLHSVRNETHQQAINFHATVANAWSRATIDRDNRTISYWRADQIVQAHDKMRADQSDLLRHQRAGFSDIRATRELMRVRGELILEDLVRNQDRGLSVEQGDRNFRELKTRDAKHEWVVARRDKVDAWARDAEVAQKRLENFDWWTNVIYTGVKTAVIIGACVAFTPAGAFVFATAWNLGEKAFKVAFNGMSFEEASRQFLIDLAIDVAFVGVLGCLKFGRGLAQSADGSIKATKYGFFWQGPFTKLSRLGGVGHSTHVAAEEIVKKTSGGTAKTWVKADAKRLINEAAKKFVGKLPEGGEKWFQYSVRGIGANTGGTSASELLKKKIHGNTEHKPTVEPSKAAELILESWQQYPQSKKVEPELPIPAPTIKEERSSEEPPGIPIPSDEPDDEEVQTSSDRDVQTPSDGDVQPPTAEPEVKSSEPSKDTIAPNSTADEPPKVWSDAEKFNLETFLKGFALINLDFLNIGLGLSGSSQATEPPNPPTVTAPPPPKSPTIPPPPHAPPGDGGGPSISPVLTNDSPKGNAYTRAEREPLAQREPQTIGTPVSYSQATRFTQADTIRAAAFSAGEVTSINVYNSDAGQTAHLMTPAEQRATMNDLYTANPVQQAATGSLSQGQEQVNKQPSAVAHLARAEAATDDSRQAARSEDVGATHERAKQESLNAERRAAQERRSAVSEDEPIILMRRRLNEKSEALAQGEVGQDIETKAAVAATRESSVPLMRDAVTIEKDAELISTTTHLKAHEKRSVSEVKREEMVLEQAQPVVRVERGIRQEQGQASVSVRQVIEGLQQDQPQLINHGEQPIEDRARWYAANPSGSASLIQSPIIRTDSMTEDLEVESLETDEKSTQHKRSNKARKQKLDAARAARERQIIIHQLMTRSFEQSQREKLLRMLIALGISEKEYRELVAQLGQAEVESQASHNQHAQKVAVQPLENTPPQHSLPTMKSSVPRQNPKIVVNLQTRTRAELYSKLRKQQG